MIRKMKFSYRKRIYLKGNAETIMTRNYVIFEGSDILIFNKAKRETIRLAL